MTKLKNRKGFTLVELIVVVAVLALLAVGAVLAIAGIQRNARMTTNRNAANEMVTAFNRHNAIAYRGDRVTSVPNGVMHTAWTHPPLMPGADSVTISVGFSSAARFTQVGGWITFDPTAIIWTVSAEGDDFDTAAR